MGLQETVLELFKEQRIGKEVAYRLLAESKKAACQAASDVRSSCRLDGVNDQLQALATWAYLLHIVSGAEEFEIDHVDLEMTRVVKIALDDQRTPRMLLESIRTELERGTPRSGDAAPYAWVRAGASDVHRRQVAAHQLPDTGDGLAIELVAERLAQNATLVEDWPDTLRHFHEVLWREPDKRFADLDRLPPRHKRLLAGYNATDAYLPPVRNLPALLDPVLAAEGDRTAVHTTKARLDYSGFKVRAYRLARLLRAHGVQRNDRVAVILHRTTDMPAALYGIICAGAAYVPLEPDMPPERIRGILQDTGASIVVTDADTLYAKEVRFEETGIRAIVCTEAWPRRRHEGLPVDDASVLELFPGLPPEPVNEPDDICYVIYTSGSTGKPKGVMVSHRAIVNTLIGVNNVLGIARDDRVLCFSSYGFDLSVWDIFGSFLAGATLVLPTKAEKQDPAAMLRLLREAQVTIWDSAPTGMSQLLLPLADREVEPLRSMRIVMLGGEFIQRSLPAEIQRLFPESRLANMGGATETTVYSIYYYPVVRFEPHWKSIPYGKPLPNQRFYVLNESLNFSAVGEKGMLYTGGLGVALGYLGDEERTRKAFVQAPWDPDERIYRTGDLGILRADGFVDICGRADRQVKLRGFRVELGEVESQLNALADVDQGAVIAKRDAGNQMRLVAFYVSRRGEIPAEDLRARLAEKLPGYMIPSQFVHLEDPPVGLTGKLDRKALEKREVSREEMGQEYVQPRSEAEQYVARELARILRLDRVGIDDDFFLIGGDSLVTLQYLSLLSKLGFSASPADILQGRTIRNVLARVGTKQKEEDRHRPVVPFTPMSRKFLERLPLVDRDHWHQLMVIGFDHQPDLPRLRHAMQKVVDHHPLLRASYAPDGLQVKERATFELEVVDLSWAPFFLRRSRLEQAVRDLRSTISLKSGSLSNAVLVRMGPEDVRLVWALHHLVVDANCWRILIDDLATAYRQPDAKLLKSPGSIADYVAAVREKAAEARIALAAHPKYQRMPVPRHSEGTGIEGDARTLRLVLPPDATQDLFRAIQRHDDVNLNVVLLTSLSLALRDWASPQVKFDIISNGRSADQSRDYSRTVGWFATHNPFEVEVPRSASAALVAVRAAWEKYQDESRYFVEVCNDVKGREDHPLGAHLDQALLYSFLGDFDSLELPDGWSVQGTVGRNRAPENPRTHELEMEALVGRGCLMVRLVYPKSVMPRREAKRLLAGFRAALSSLVEQLGTQTSAVAPALALEGCAT